LAEYKVPVTTIIKAVTDSGSNFLKAFKEYQAGEQITIDDGDEEDFENELSLVNSEVEFIDVHCILTNHEVDAEIVLPPHHPCSSHKLNLIGSSDINKIKQ